MTTATTKKNTSKRTQQSETVDVQSLQLQLQQMMELMAQQQQVIATLSQNKEKQEDKKDPKNKKQLKSLTKQYLRRTYKDVEVYLQNVTHGIVSYKCRDGIDVVWSGYGDVQPVSIDDVLAMDSKFLSIPWLAVDETENDETLFDDLLEVLKLENPLIRCRVLAQLEEDINGVDLDEIKEMIVKAKDKTLLLDVCTCVQQKIKNGELESYKRIEQFEKIVGRKFEMQE